MSTCVGVPAVSVVVLVIDAAVVNAVVVLIIVASVVVVIVVLIDQYGRSLQQFCRYSYAGTKHYQNCDDCWEQNKPDIHQMCLPFSKFPYLFCYHTKFI